jgi:hypothetical protein
VLELNGKKPSSVTTFSTDFSFQNLVFWNLFEVSAAAEITLKSISPTILNPSLNQINSIKSSAHQDLSNNAKGTYIPIPLNFFHYVFYLVFSEEIIQYSRTFAPRVQTS